MRDYATLEQLVVLSNLESLNAELIKMGISANDRLQKLNKTAIEQMKALVSNISLKALQQEEHKMLTGKERNKSQ